MPIIVANLQRLGFTYSYYPGMRVVDIGAGLGESMHMFEILGVPIVDMVGYETDPLLCSKAEPPYRDHIHCSALSFDDYVDYVGKRYFIKMDCEGCEKDYLFRLWPTGGLVSVHSWVKGHEELGYEMMRAGWIPVFHSYDWREITYYRAIREPSLFTRK